jgi:hypothetical protein
MKRLGTSFRSREPRDPHPLPCFLFNLITLITYLFSFLLFVCLACPCASVLTYPSPHHLTCTGVGLSTYVILSFFYFTLLSHQSFYFVPKFVFHQSFFHFSAPGSCLPLFTFVFLWLHFSPSWLPSGSLLLCLLKLFVCGLCRNLNCLCQLKLVWVGLTGCVL